MFKVKCSKADGEKAERSSDLSSLYDSAINPFKICSQTNLKDSSNNLGYIKNAGIVIPPINWNVSPTASAVVSVPGNSNCRYKSRARKTWFFWSCCWGTVMCWGRCRVVTWVWGRMQWGAASGWRMVCTWVRKLGFTSSSSKGPCREPLCFCIWQSPMGQ